MFDRTEFDNSKEEWLKAQGADIGIAESAQRFVQDTIRTRYSYQWTWLGMPMIQLPADVIALQEIIANTKPDVIVETGIAWGGSTVLYASILELLGNGKVIAVDRVLPEHNRQKIMSFPFSKRITLLEGSSVDADTVAQIRAQIPAGAKVMVILDSNHSHAHVLDELKSYSPLVQGEQYLVVLDTVVEFIEMDPAVERPWGKGNNPMTAVWAFLQENKEFEQDKTYDWKTLTTYGPGGFLRRKS